MKRASTVNNKTIDLELTFNFSFSAIRKKRTDNPVSSFYKVMCKNYFAAANAAA